MRKVESIEKIEYNILSNGYAQPRPWVGEEIALKLGDYTDPDERISETAHLTVRYVGKLGEKYAFVKGNVKIKGEELPGEAKFMIRRQYTEGTIMGRLLLRRVATSEV